MSLKTSFTITQQHVFAGLLNVIALKSEFMVPPVQISISVDDACECCVYFAAHQALGTVSAGSKVRRVSEKRRSTAATATVISSAVHLCDAAAAAGAAF